VIPGYDGVYGQLVIFDQKQEEVTPQKPSQKSISDFM
jgi:hypothetical protein